MKETERRTGLIALGKKREYLEEQIERLSKDKGAYDSLISEEAALLENEKVKRYIEVQRQLEKIRSLFNFNKINSYANYNRAVSTLQDAPSNLSNIFHEDLRVGTIEECEDKIWIRIDNSEEISRFLETKYSVYSCLECQKVKLIPEEKQKEFEKAHSIIYACSKNDEHRIRREYYSLLLHHTAQDAENIMVKRYIQRI